ncbi:MAG: hypothetical protein AB2A00_17075 [Myxococcota bacterium]
MALVAQDAITIAEALHLEGVEDPASVSQARALLDGEGITNPKRDRISRDKQPRVHEALHHAFFFHCTAPNCQKPVQHSGKPGLLVRREMCLVCGGSNTRRAVQEALEACAATGIRRVCLVGGSPGIREELERQLGSALKLTLVDGTQTPSSNQARAHVRGHDVTIICGSSELSHKLSNTYGACARDGAVITVARRGVEAIAEGLTIHARGRRR